MQTNLAFLVTFWVLQGFWALGAVAASSVHMLTRTQMVLNGIKKGMPYFWHFGMWNDVVTIHPFLALMAGLYWAQWTQGWWPLVLVVLGLANLYVSWWQNREWVRDVNIVQAHSELAADKVHSTGEMNAVSWVHVPHMAIILTLLLMSAIWTIKGEVPWKLATGGVFLFAAHALIGQHWPLRLFKPWWNPWPDQELTLVFALLTILFWILGAAFLFSYFADTAA